MKSKNIKVKVVHFTATVDFEVESEFVENINTLPDEVLGQLVRIKTGNYENVAFGDITNVTNVKESFTIQKVVSQ